MLFPPLLFVHKHNVVVQKKIFCLVFALVLLVGGVAIYFIVTVSVPHGESGKGSGRTAHVQHQQRQGVAGNGTDSGKLIGDQLIAANKTPKK